MPDLTTKSVMTAATHVILAATHKILALTWFCQLSICQWSQGEIEKQISMSKIDF